MPRRFAAERGRRHVLSVGIAVVVATLVLAIGWPGGARVGEAGQPAYMVNSTVDAVDANIGNNVCETATAGQCTLRAAVQEANAQAAGRNIIFDSSIDGLPITLTIAGTDDTAAAGDLDLTTSVPMFILGNGIQNTIIRACNDGSGGTPCAGVDRIFHKTGNGFTSITGLTLRRGTTSGGGGALLHTGGGTVDIRNVEMRNNSAGGGFFTGTGAINTTGGDVTIVDSTLAANTGTTNGFDDANGGGLWMNAGTVSVRSSTFSDNSVGNGDVDRGGGIYVAGGALTVVNSTFNGNAAPDGGAAIYRNGGTAALSHVTIAQNVGTALGGSATVKNSIVAASSGSECLGAFTMLGVNVVDDTSCGVAGPTIIVGDPLLQALGNNGGPTQTHGLPYQSPAVDVATDCTEAGGAGVGLDQRGVERPQDGKLPEGAECDAGSFEREANAPLIVDSALDATDNIPGDGSCNTGAGVCTLRAAVREANARSGLDTILFDPALDGTPITLTIAGNDDKTDLGDLDVLEFLVIEGNGRLNTIVRACDDGDGSVNCLGIDRIFHVTSAVPTLRVSDMTLRRGNTPGGGSAIFNQGGQIGVQNVDLVANTASGGASVGTGAINITGGQLLIFDATFARNVGANGFDDSNGGALYMADGSVSIQRTAFVENTAGPGDLDRGGAIYAAAGLLIVTNATFDGNTAPDGGAAIHNNGASMSLNHVTITDSDGIALTGTATVKNSIIGDSSAGNCAGAAKVMQGVNIVDDATCGAAGPTIVVADPLLDVLAEWGGITPSRKPLTGSPAIDTALDCTLIGGGFVGGDQRALVRPIDADAVPGAECDIGSHEVSKGTPNTDLDACTDEEEAGPNRLFGGERNATDGWDFYDVTGDQAIDLVDAIAILQQFGFGPATPGYDPSLDREAFDTSRLWRTSAATGTDIGIDVSDVILNLQSFGHSCAGPP